MKHVIGALAIGMVLVCPHADAADRAGMCNSLSVYAFASAFMRDHGVSIDKAVAIARDTGESDNETADVQEAIVRGVYAPPRNPPSKEAANLFRECMQRGGRNL